MSDAKVLWASAVFIFIVAFNVWKVTTRNKKLAAIEAFKSAPDVISVKALVRILSRERDVVVIRKVITALKSLSENHKHLRFKIAEQLILLSREIETGARSKGWNYSFRNRIDDVVGQVFFGIRIVPMKVYSEGDRWAFDRAHFSVKRDETRLDGDIGTLWSWAHYLLETSPDTKGAEFLAQYLEPYYGDSEVGDDQILNIAYRPLREKVLMRLLASSKERVRQSAIWFLSYERVTAAILPIAEILSSGRNIYAANHALKELGAGQELILHANLRVLEKNISGGDEAALFLAAMNDTRAVMPLAHYLRQWPSEKVAKALSSLINGDDKLSYEAGLVVLDSKISSNGKWAVDVLANLGGERVIAVLLQVLSEGKFVDTINQALIPLGVSPERRRQANFEAVSKKAGQDDDDQYHAVQTLLDLGDVRAIEASVRYLETDHADDIIRAWVKLAGGDRKLSFELALKAIKSTNPKVINWGIEQLQQLGGDKAVMAIAEVLRQGRSIRLANEALKVLRADTGLIVAVNVEALNADWDKIKKEWDRYGFDPDHPRDFLNYTAPHLEAEAKNAASEVLKRHGHPLGAYGYVVINGKVERRCCS